MQKGRIGTIGNNHRLINQKKENFQGVSAYVKVVTKHSEREKVNANIQGKRGRKGSHRRAIRQEGKNDHRRKIKTKRKRANQTGIHIMVHSMKGIGKKNMGRRGHKIEKIIRSDQKRKIRKREMVMKEIISICGIFEDCIIEKTKVKIIKIADCLGRKNPMCRRKECMASKHCVSRISM